MSNSPDSERVSLLVCAEDPAAEVFVIDGSFRLVERGRGTLWTALPPGIYKVKARVGHETWEQHVVLRPGGPEVTATVKLRFASPVPLVGTSLWHEQHAALAEKESRRVHVRTGAGSSVFVMAREWRAGSGNGAVTPANPALGLTLRRDGELVADLATVAVMEQHSAQPPAACATTEIAPGVYTLTLELASGRRLHQTVVASAGWQTQVFMLMRDYTRDDRRADLPGAAIHLSRGQFAANAGQLRLAELTRLAVANDRWVVSDPLKEILREKYENPMLGIMGGHLLLMEPEPDLPLVTEVVSSLRGLLGAGSHPDVEALALRTAASDPAYRFTIPPMLRQSWDLVLEASASKPALVPPGSLAESISARVMASEPWLTWFEAEAQESGSGPGLEADVEFVLGRLRELLRVLAKATMPQEANRGRRVSLLEAGQLVARHLRTLVAPEVLQTTGAIVTKIATEAWRQAGGLFSRSPVAAPPGTLEHGESEFGAESPAVTDDRPESEPSAIGTDADAAVPVADDAAAAGGQTDGLAAAKRQADSTDADMEIRQLRQELSPESVRRLMITLGVPRGRLEYLLDRLEHPTIPVVGLAVEPASDAAGAAPGGEPAAIQEHPEPERAF